jgi:hypothetical protein
MTNRDNVPTIDRMKAEIDHLTGEQADALRTATYLGMTPEDTKEYDDRSSRITSLLQEVERLEAA